MVECSVLNGESYSFMKIIQPRPFNLRKTLTMLAVLSVAFYFYYQREPPLRFWIISGAKWSAYTVKFTDNRLPQAAIEQIKKDIDIKLDEINRQMSTYIPDSEINVFNQALDTDPKTASTEFSTLVQHALDICKNTGGAFNPTLDHLINIWGFGSKGPQKEPTESEVTAALSTIGCDKIDVLPDGRIRKTIPDATINLNAIAEGWAVDEVSRLLEGLGITNYFVEIGGEVFARGLSEKVRKWRVGIDRPIEGALPGAAFDTIVEMDGMGLATSGSYRNFVINDQGRKIAHILDPRTGRPTTSDLASVTVIAPDCMTADATATALFVMGTKEGLEWVNQNPGIEALFIQHTDDGSLDTMYSRGFEQYLLADKP